MSNWNVWSCFNFLKTIRCWSKVSLITTVKKLFSILKLFLFSNFSKQFILINLFLILFDCAFLRKPRLFRSENPPTGSFMLFTFIGTVWSWTWIEYVSRDITMSIYLSLSINENLFDLILILTLFLWRIISRS